jgi:LacI family transcriptional regulator
MDLLARPIGERPTAVYAVNLPSALGFRAAARERSVQIPDEISLVTMDDHPMLEHLDPALTSIRMPMDEMGRRGADMLLDVVAGGPLRHEVTTTAPCLVSRRSTAPPVG